MIALVELEESLVAACQLWFAEFKAFTGRKDEEGKPLYGELNIYQGFLPLNTADESEEIPPNYYPHLVIRSKSGSFDDNVHSVEVVFELGAVDNAVDQSGYRDIRNMIQRLTTGLRTQTLVNGFPIDPKSVKWELIGDNELYPSWHGEVTATYKVKAPQSVLLTELAKAGPFNWVEEQLRQGA